MVAMSKSMVTISARIRKSQAEEVNQLAMKRGVDRSAVVRGLLDKAIQEEKVEEALGLVRAGKVTVWRAADIAGVTYREMLESLRIHNIPFPLSNEELKREIEEILTGK
jgi:predicted HTH domain antitoxin